MTQIECKGLLIDMDGVLVDSTPAVARVWARWAEKHGMDGEYVTKFAHGRPARGSIEELLPKQSAAQHDAEEQWMETAELDDIADVVALPGTDALLAALHADQFAVVTSASRKLAEVRLRAAGLWTFVKHLVTASEIVRGKPDPEPYLKGAAKLNLDGRDCVVIEDAPSGTRSGKAAGARVLALRTTTADAELKAAGADWIVNDCASVRVATERLPGQILLELLRDTVIREPKMS